MDVRNLKGTGDRTCGCGSWLDHYKKHCIGTPLRVCSIMMCSETATVGAHVEIRGRSGQFIIPMCNGCNKKDGWLNAWDPVGVASANVNETCGKAKTILTSGSGYRGSWPTR